MEGAHWSAPNSFGGRAFFRAERNISYLLITNVTAEVSKLLIVDPKTQLIRFNFILEVNSLNCRSNSIAFTFIEHAIKVWIQMSKR